MPEVHKIRGLVIAKRAGMARLSAACVIHAIKSAAHTVEHELGPAGHAASPGLD